MKGFTVDMFDITFLTEMLFERGNNTAWSIV